MVNRGGKGQSVRYNDKESVRLAPTRGCALKEGVKVAPLAMAVNDLSSRLTSV